MSRGWLCHPLLITLRLVVFSSFACHKVGASVWIMQAKLKLFWGT